MLSGEERVESTRFRTLRRTVSDVEKRRQSQSAMGQDLGSKVKEELKFKIHG
jgi:hypothetical protein